MANIQFKYRKLNMYMGHSTELVQTAVPQPKNKFKKHLSNQVLFVY